MAPQSGTIVDSQVVEPSHIITAQVKKLYDTGVIEQTVLERITYMSDGLRINGYMARPSEPGEYPVLIWNRGGTGNRGALDNMTAFLILASTAVWGYVVIGSQYRGNKGSEGKEDWGGKDLDDSLNLLKVAENTPECDMSRVAVEGASRGGLVTYRALLKEHRFKCAIVHAGITDVLRLCHTKNEFRQYLNQKFDNLCAEDREAQLRRLSVIDLAGQLPQIPILIMHGSNDRVVPIEQSKLLVEQLEKHGIPHEFRIIEGGGHVALKDGSYREIDRYRKAWLEMYLKPASS